MKLTSKTVAALKLDGKRDRIVFDDELHGFGYRLRLGASGNVLRSWIVQYRRAGASRRLLLGSAEVLPAEQARTMARKALLRVANGEDPQADKADRRDKDKLTLRALIDEYLAAKQVSPRWRIELVRYLTIYCRPLHGMPVDSLSRKDIAGRLVAIGREHGSIPAARTRAALSAFFTWAMQMGMVEANPVIGTVKPQDTTPRERVLSNDELVRIWRSCGDDDFGRITKLLILMPCRRSEIGACAWREFSDLEGPRPSWTLPAERSKNGRPHTLPLLPMALDVIKAVPKMATRDHLFGVRGNGFTRWGDGKAALDQRSGVTDPWVLQDIRRTVATRMADLEVQPHIIEQILNHQSGHKSGVAGIYNRSTYDQEVRKALALWHDHVRTLVEGGERKIFQLPATA